MDALCPLKSTFFAICNSDALTYYIRNGCAGPPPQTMWQCFEQPRTVTLPSGRSLQVDVISVESSLRFALPSDRIMARAACLVWVEHSDTALLQRFLAVSTAPVIRVVDVRGESSPRSVTTPTSPALTGTNLEVDSITGEGIEGFMIVVASVLLAHHDGRSAI
jgi:hypothetical protein